MPRQGQGSPEDRLLTLLARGTMPPDVEDAARSLLAQTLSWPVIMRQARTHGVSPLVYRNLSRVAFRGVPGEVRADLAADCRVNAVRNILLAQELMAVMTLLGDAGIPVIPLKGVALARSLYGDVTLRVCADIDILVPRAMVARAFRLLRRRGYRAEFTERFFEDLLLRGDIEYALVRSDARIRYQLDLHWGLLFGSPRDRAAAAELWAAARPDVFFGVPGYAMNPEWELLFLAAHAARHRWHGLKWLADIHEICCRGGIDWPMVGATAARLGWEEVLQVALTACQGLFGTPAPPHHSEQGSPTSEDVSPASKNVSPEWLTAFPGSPPDADIWRSAFVPIRLLRAPSAKLGYLARALLVPTLAERRLLRLPSWLALLYYPLRPLRLGWRLGWRLAAAGARRVTWAPR